MMNPQPMIDLNDLPLDAFELAGDGVDVEHLTAGHGLEESSDFCNTCCCFCRACCCVAN